MVESPVLSLQYADMVESVSHSPLLNDCQCAAFASPSLTALTRYGSTAQVSKTRQDMGKRGIKKLIDNIYFAKSLLFKNKSDGQRRLFVL